MRNGSYYAGRTDADTVVVFVVSAVRVASHRHANLMGAENLATVFAPNLLRSPESEVLCGLSALKNERDLIELLIRHCDLLLD